MRIGIIRRSVSGALVIGPDPIFLNRSRQLGALVAPVIDHDGNF